MIQIYHNPRCRKSRAGLQYLLDNGIQPQIIDYIKNPLAEEELKLILAKLNKKPTEIIRTQEELYRKELKGKNFSDEEWIHILVENPKLIQRPIIVKDHKAVIGDPVSAIEKIIA